MPATRTRRIAMTTMGDLKRRFSRRQRRHAAVRDQVQRLKEKLERMKAPYWVDVLVRPVAEAIADRLECEAEILGPFGIGCEVRVSFKTTKGQQSLAVRPTHDDDTTMGLAIVDYSANTSEYKAGTLGAINGLNHPAHSVPDDADLDWFVAQLSKE